MKKINFEFAKIENIADLAEFMAIADNAKCKPDAIRKKRQELFSEAAMLTDGTLKILMAKADNKIIGCLTFEDKNDAISVRKLHIIDMKDAQKEKALEKSFGNQLEMYSHKQNGKMIVGKEASQHVNFEMIFLNTLPAMHLANK